MLKILQLTAVQKNVLSSTALRLLGKGIQVSLGILAVRTLTTQLGAESYGVYGKMMELSLFLASWANLGIPNHATRVLSEDSADQSTFKDLLILRIWSAALVFGGAFLIWNLQMGHDAPPLASGFFLLAAALFFDQIHALVEAALQARYKMGWAAAATLAARSTNLAGILSLKALHVQNPNAFTLTPLLASVVLLAVSSLGLRKCWPRSNSKAPIAQPFWNWAHQKKLLLSALPFGAISALNLFYFRFGISSEAASKLPSEGFALYNTGWDIAGNLSLISTFFMLAVLPGLHHALSAGQKKEAKNLFKFASLGILTLMIGLVGVGIPLAPWGLHVISGKTFDSSPYFVLIPALMGLAAISYLYDLALLTQFALGNDRRWLLMELLMLVIFLSGRHLLNGAEMGSPLTQVLACIGLSALCELSISLWGLADALKTLNRSSPKALSLPQKIC